MKNGFSIFNFGNLTEADKSSAVQKLIHTSTPSRDFFIFVTLSVTMAALGLLLDNPAIIIGSMLIAPILYPVMSLSLGFIMSDSKLINRSFSTLVKSSGLAVIASAIIAVFLSGGQDLLTDEVLSRTKPSLMYFGVALIAGYAGSLALIKKELSETLPGVAISVALIPPLATVGIGLAGWDWFIIKNALLLYMLNIAGIVFISMINFSFMNLYVKRKIAAKVIAEEDKVLEKENGKI
jgi:uncharacterized hydrophobic protein (TIGR00271 family)